jgi:hypothetical protein
MRCPKCGFISFDHLESCKICQKSLADLIATISGTTYDATPPMFLTVPTNDRAPASSSAGISKTDTFAAPAADEPVINFDESGESVFSLDDDFTPAELRKEIEFPEGADGLLMDLDDFGEDTPEEEFTLQADEPAKEETPLPSMDFGDLDISDLAPPTHENPEPIHFEESPVLSDLEPVASMSPTPPPPPQSSGMKAGLEDLNFNGLDLDTPAKLVTGSAAGKRFLPSVKTGTALDKFDIDLGDLFSDKK